MRIVEHYPHLNGLEYLMLHKPELWSEIQQVIANVDATKFKTKVSKERTMHGKMLYAPILDEQGDRCKVSGAWLGRIQNVILGDEGRQPCSKNHDDGHCRAEATDH